MDYPSHLINCHPPTDSQVIAARPGQRIRLRLINAAADTDYRIALGDHRLRVLVADGSPTHPVTWPPSWWARASATRRGRRGGGVIPLVAVAEGKGGLARALIRAGGGAAPHPAFRPSELNRELRLRPPAGSGLTERRPDRSLTKTLAREPLGAVALDHRRPGLPRHAARRDPSR